MSSYTVEMNSLPGVLKSLEELGFGGNNVNKKEAGKTIEEEEDDDIDLFGSDDEVDEEAEKIKQERLKVKSFY